MIAIAELEDWFNGVELPMELRISSCEVIRDVGKCVGHSFNVIRNNEPRRYESDLNRLLKIKRILEKQL